MKTPKNTGSTELTRREMLKLSGAAVGGLAVGGAMIGPGAGDARAQEPGVGDACTCPEGPT
jgi:hypothetical protein